MEYFRFTGTTLTVPFPFVETVYFSLPDDKRIDALQRILCSMRKKSERNFPRFKLDPIFQVVPRHPEQTGHGLRNMADKVAFGTKHCASLVIYLRVRDIPRSHRPRAYQEYENEPLPKRLSIPKPLELSLTPEGA